MERFAIKIDKKLKANLYKICRLCGIDNPNMVPIISENPKDECENDYIDIEAEMEMEQKINILLGLSITKDDRMPQTMCCLCVDKINDFYEFREMCYATNAQTRKLLGLKNFKKPAVDIKPKVEIKAESIVPTPMSVPVHITNKNVNRKRKPEEVSLKEELAETSIFSSKKKIRLSIQAEANVKEENPVQSKKKLRFSASIEDLTSSVSGGSKKVKNSAEDTKLKKEPSPPVPVPPAAISNKKLRLVGPPQKELATKKSKQKGGKTAEQKEGDIKEEIKEEINEELPNALCPLGKVLPKHKFGCNICKERFPAKINLEAHTRTTHIPKVERFVCTACNEVLSKSFDIKNHQLWHKLSKTPYVCGCCGESILNTYAFSRHLREHAFETPPALQVLDRECPQCRTLYATNFLYNIHVCAVKTKRCAGCNRIQRNEAEYLKHSAQCAKVYLNYSKHIMPSVEALEDAVRIKNENDVEAAAEEMARISGVSLDMAPIVQLTRLSSPLLMAASQCVSTIGLDDVASTSSKKSGKKGVSKKDLKRVDELLKSTLDALVSIKHEPEMHVDQETPCDGDHSDIGDHEVDDDLGIYDDTHHNDISDNENEANTSSNVFSTGETSMKNESGLGQIKIKQEHDETNDDNANKIGGGLKLKIKKEHGQLNSSIIEQQKSSEKRVEKRKKKKKHKEKEKDKHKLSKDIQDEQLSQDSSANNNNIRDVNMETTTVHIKSEPQEGSETLEPTSPSLLQIRPQPEATIMTSIPMMQFQIACVASGVEFNNSNPVVESDQTISLANHDTEPEDVKPNREELDRMLKISHISSGVNIEIHQKDEKENEEIEHGSNYDKKNVGDDDEVDYHEECNEYDQHGDGNGSEHEGNNQSQYNEDENSEVDDKINNDVGIDNKKVIDEKIENTLLQSKHKLIFNSKDKTVTTHTKSRNKACKSTAKPSNIPSLQICAVQSGVMLEPTPFNSSDFTSIFIKPEPQNRGYSDEQPTVSDSTSFQESYETETQYNTGEFSASHTAEEQNYISSIDFSNISIKQEKDIEINDVQITQKTIKSFAKLNGVKRKRKHVNRSHRDKDKMLDQDDLMEDNEENMDDYVEQETDEETDGEENDDEDVDDEEEEEEIDEEEDEEIDYEDEVREYRELEYPPELVEKKKDVETEVDNKEDNKTIDNINAAFNGDNDSTAKENISSASNDFKAHNEKPKDISGNLSRDNNSNIKEDINDTTEELSSNISSFAITNVSSGVSDQKKFFKSSDHNISIAGNLAVAEDLKAKTFSEPDHTKYSVVGSLGNNAEIMSPTASTEISSVANENSLNYVTKKKRYDTHSVTGFSYSSDNSVIARTDNSKVITPQTCTKTTISSDEGQSLTQSLQRATKSNEASEVSYFNKELSISNSTSQSSQLKENFGRSNSQFQKAVEKENLEQSAREPQNKTEDTDRIRHVFKTNEQESSQTILKYGAEIISKEKNSPERVKNCKEKQLKSLTLLEKLPNIQCLEVKPQTSKHFKTSFETSSVRAADVDGNPELKLSDKSLEGTVTIEGIVKQSKYVSLEAKPIIENADKESANNTENELVEESNNDDELLLGNNLEECQNDRNQEVLSEIRPTALALHPYLEDISSSSNSLLSNSLSQTPPPPPLQSSTFSTNANEFKNQVQQQQRVLNTEETENILNESNDILSRRSQDAAETSGISMGQIVTQSNLGQLLPPHMPTFNFDNINEIAENNNNANIEREQLQDEQQQNRYNQQD